MENVIIIGSGPAGLTAGIYTARANLNPVMFEGNQAGGQLTLTTEVENFPGFPEGIMGPDLMLNMKAQAERFGCRVVSSTATKVNLSGRPFKVWVGDEEFQAKTVIVATGARARMLGLEAEKRLIGRGISTCATCDGAFFRDQVIMVVGGGDSALEEATFLTRFGKSVTVVHRRDELRGSKIMRDRAKKNPKISFLWDSTVEEAVGGDQLTTVKIKNVKTGAVTEHPCDGLFYALGHVPNTDLFKGQLDMEESGYLISKPGTAQTSIPGVFACGDVQDHVYRQAITAAGSGCMAAIEAERWLEAMED